MLFFRGTVRYEKQRAQRRRTEISVSHLFIIEGIDGSGKTTQTALLQQRLTDRGIANRRIKLPNYGYGACKPVELYLAGEFGSDPDSVNAYAASTFFAVDRYAYFRRFWESDYRAGTVILSDRYVSSNLLHQCSKLPPECHAEYAEWLEDLEYEKIGIPRPDAVFFLDVSPSVTRKMLEKRYGGDESKKDIHERDEDYLNRCYNVGLQRCSSGDFTRISCVGEDGLLRDKEEICNDILSHILRITDREK